MWFGVRSAHKRTLCVCVCVCIRRFGRQNGDSAELRGYVQRI